MSIDYSKYEGHTEGPFEYDEPSGMVRNDSMTFADVRGWGHLSRKHGDVRALEIQRANGRLIADAPLLLKRCRELEEMREGILALLSFSEHDHRVIESVYALLKKTGTTE